MLFAMDMKRALKPLTELTRSFTQLASDYPFEVGILLGALGMAVVWGAVSLGSDSRIRRENVKPSDSRKVEKLTIEEIREKARRRL